VNSFANIALYSRATKYQKTMMAPGNIPSTLQSLLGLQRSFPQMAMVSSTGRFDIYRLTSLRNLALDSEQHRSEDPTMIPYTAAHSASSSYCSRPCPGSSPPTSLPPADQVDAPPVDRLEARVGVPACLISFC
jgi:hypothetical protein